MAKTSVLFFIEGVNFGGQQTFSLNILKHLDSERFDLTTTYIFDGDLKEEYNKISSQLVRIGKPYDPFNAFANKLDFFKMAMQLRKLVKKEKIDVLISNGFMSYFASCIATAFRKTKHIRFIGGDLRKNEAFHFVKRFHLLPLHRFTDKFVGYNAILNEIEAKGVSREKLNNLFFQGAVDTEHFSPKLDKAEVQQLRVNHNIPKDHIVIGWLGRIEKNMEIRFTLELVLTLKKKGFDQFVFLIIGDGNWRNEMHEKIAENDLEKHIRFLGFVNQQELPPLIQMVDIMPLLDTDPIGGSILREAMACGTMPLTVDGPSGEQRNIIENGSTGILVKPDDFVENAAKEIMNLASQQEVISNMGNQARAFAEAHMSFKTLSLGLEKMMTLD